jgi:hypothetical protein
MSEARLTNPKVIGLWTRLLLHPKQAPPTDYARLKELFAAHGATVSSTQNVQPRTPEQILATRPSERSLELWKCEDDEILIREDGVMFLSELGAAVATLLHQVIASMQDWPQLQTFSIAPTVPDTDAYELLSLPVSTIIAPLDQGPFQNARFWTTVNHIQEGLKTRERFYEKQGITLQEPSPPEDSASS